MELLLIRHALPVRRELVEGSADPELSEAGFAQAEHLARYLVSEQLHAIYASPLRRAVQTAAPVAQQLGLPVTVLDGIAEYDRHSNEYVPIEELKAANDPRWQQMLDDAWSNVEETRDEFAARVFAAIEGVIAEHPGENVAVICHGGVINSYLAAVLGVPNSVGFFYPNYTSIHRVLASRAGQRQILTINETHHLRGTGLPVGLYGK
jgi:probable phosphoglycerate mutase